MGSTGESMLFEMCMLVCSRFSLLLSPSFSLAYSTFYIVGLILSMQIPFVGFQPIRTSEHMAAAGKKTVCLQTACTAKESLKPLCLCFLVLEIT